MQLRFSNPFRRPPLSEQAAAKARIDSKLRAIERQGSGGVHFGHALAYALVFTFSVGALIALAGDAMRVFITQAQHGAVDIPSMISFVVSFVLVFAMDTAMVRAAATVRMLNQRHQPGMAVHIAVIVTVCVVESATYLYMSYEYDHPGRQVVVWAILAVRAVVAPIVAVYLSLGRILPVSARDINTQVEVVTGRGVLMDMTRIADDPASTTERKVALYRASAVMDEADRDRLSAIIEAERSTRDATQLPAADHVVDASKMISTRQPDITSPRLPAMPRPVVPGSSRDRREKLASGMFGHEWEWNEDADGEDFSDLADEDRAYGESERPGRNNAVMSQQVAPRKRSNSSAARIAPASAELIVPIGKTALPVDSPEGRRVMNYLDKHPGAKRADVMRGARVAEGTAKTYITLWKDRKRQQGFAVASATQEMPALTPALIAEMTQDEAAEG